MKDFIIIGNKNAYQCQNIFPLIKEQKLFIGYTHPDGFDKVKGLTRWFSTIKTFKDSGLILHKKYNPELYPVYDNYPAIEVNKVKNIPYDYEGKMGVPITYLDKIDNRYKIIGLLQGFCTIDEYVLGHQPKINGRNIYTRMIIQKI